MRRFTVHLLCLAAVAALTLGCGPKADTKQPDADHDHAHDHAEEGPHHGHLIELGGGAYHAEWKHEHDTHTTTIYVLDGKAKNAVPVAAPDLTLNIVLAGQPAQYTLTAAPQETDPAGQASRFVLTDEALCDALDTAGVTGRLSIDIDGKSYSGELEHHDHHGDEHTEADHDEKHAGDHQP
jgi:hypothetical protein